MFKKTVLPNKLRIITAPMNGTNTVTVLVMCNTGSDNETEKERGISHFLEHMFFKGTKNRPNPQIIKHELDGMGCAFNAFTSHEYTGYFIKAGHVHLDRALEILSDVYSNSLLSPEEIERERQVIIEEKHMNDDDPQSQVWRAYVNIMYGNQHAGWDVIGTEAHIKAFTPEQFSDYFKKQYTSKNTTVIVAGNINEKKTITTVKKLFGSVRSGNPRPKFPFSVQQSKPAIKTVFKETDQSHIIVGFHAPDAFSKDRHAADMLATILGGNQSSRMWDTIRDTMGLAYSVFTMTDMSSNRGFLATYAGVAHNNLEKTLKAIRDEYVKIVEKGVTEQELARAKEYTRGHMLIGLESSNAVASFIGVEEAVTGKPMTVDEVFKEMNRVTAQDVQKIAQKIITGKGLNAAILGPHKNASAFQKALTL